MDGVNILATITNNTVNGSFLLFFLGTVSFVTLALAVWCTDGFIFWGNLSMFLGILCFACIFIFSIGQEVTYKATIDDTVTVQALEEKYIIVDKVDDLYTLKLKENEDE